MRGNADALTIGVRALQVGFAAAVPGLQPDAG